MSMKNLWKASDSCHHEIHLKWFFLIFTSEQCIDNSREGVMVKKNTLNILNMVQKNITQKILNLWIVVTTQSE